MPHTFVTLATPHLGVRGLYSSKLLWLGRNLGLQTAAELDFNDTSNPVLLQMTESPFLDGLRSFQHRIAYAPIPDDGTVAFSTAGITGRSAPTLDAVGAVVRAVHQLPADSTDWIGPEEEAYFIAQKPDQSRRSVMWAAICNLHRVQWTIAEVALMHDKLATLYPTERKSTKRNTMNFEVATHILNEILNRSDCGAAPEAVCKACL